MGQLCIFDKFMKNKGKFDVLAPGYRGNMSKSIGNKIEKRQFCCQPQDVAPLY